MKPENTIVPIQYRISGHAIGGGLLYQSTARIHGHGKTLRVLLQLRTLRVFKDLKTVVLRLFSISINKAIGQTSDEFIRGCL